MHYGRHKAKHSKAKAPTDIEVFERALHFKRDPAEVRLYDDGTLTLAVVMEKKPEEVSRWDERDKRWLLTLLAAQQAK